MDPIDLDPQFYFGLNVYRILGYLLGMAILFRIVFQRKPLLNIISKCMIQNFFLRKRAFHDKKIRQVQMRL